MTATATTEIRNFVGGEERPDAEHGNEPILNPANEEEIATAPKSGESDVDAAVKAAYDAFGTWGFTTPGERATALLKIADAIARDPGLRSGVNVAAGNVTHPAVAQGVGMPFTPVEEALQPSEETTWPRQQ